MIVDEDVDAFLEHFGVRGMKWGHRKESKYFAPTTKSERQEIRRSASAKKGKVIIAKAGTSFAVGLGSGYVAQRIAGKHYDRITSTLIGNLTAFAGSLFTARILGLNH